MTIGYVIDRESELFYKGCRRGFLAGNENYNGRKGSMIARHEDTGALFLGGLTPLRIHLLEIQSDFENKMTRRRAYCKILMPFDLPAEAVVISLLPYGTKGSGSKLEEVL